MLSKTIKAYVRVRHGINLGSLTAAEERNTGASSGFDCRLS